jgi:hypothetical protein
MKSSDLSALADKIRNMDRANMQVAIHELCNAVVTITEHLAVPLVVPPAPATTPATTPAPKLEPKAPPKRRHT